MSANGTEARVAKAPLCDFCLGDADRETDATYDGRTAYGWAFMCDEHWDTHGPGHTGLGVGQRLVVTTEPEQDPDCLAHPGAYVGTDPETGTPVIVIEDAS